MPPTVVDPRTEDLAALLAEARHAEGPRLKADVAHEGKRDEERSHQQSGADKVGDGQVDLTQQSADQGPEEHGDVGEDAHAREDAVLPSGEPRSVEGVDQPGIHRPRLAREAEPQEDGGEDETGQAPVEHGRAHVAKGGHGQRADAEEERSAAPDRVGHHARWNLEHDLAGAEGGVDEHHLEDVQTGVEEEEGVDSPDDRRRQREEGVDRVVGALDAPRGVGDRWAHGRGRLIGFGLILDVLHLLDLGDRLPPEGQSFADPPAQPDEEPGEDSRTRSSLRSAANPVYRGRRTPG